MDDEPEQSLPDVSTEPQRQALDAMSQQLVERLNTMVREQHERARRFAATQHSLFPLPQLPELEAENSLPSAPQAEPEFTFTVPEPAPLPQAKKRLFAPIPPRPTEPRQPQDFSAKPLWEAAKQNWPIKPKAAESSKKQEEGCGTISTVVCIIIIIMLMRACS